MVRWTASLGATAQHHSMGFTPAMLQGPSKAPCRLPICKKTSLSHEKWSHEPVRPGGRSFSARATTGTGSGPGPRTCAPQRGFYDCHATRPIEGTLLATHLQKYTSVAREMVSQSGATWGPRRCHQRTRSCSRATHLHTPAWVLRLPWYKVEVRRFFLTSLSNQMEKTTQSCDILLQNSLTENERRLGLQEIEKGGDSLKV